LKHKFFISWVFGAQVNFQRLNTSLVKKIKFLPENIYNVLNMPSKVDYKII